MRRVVMVAASALGGVLAGCGDGSEDTGDRRSAPGSPTPDIVAALAPTPDGGLLSGELASGIVRRHARPGRTARRLDAGRAIAQLPVGTGGQRGLLGLAAADDGRIWVSRVLPGADGRLVVDRIAPGDRRRVWDGPVATALATGGHLVHDPATDRLVVGIGDLQDPPAVADPKAPNGKLLALDPSGPADQRPRILSGGWNNPFAFARAPEGEIVVADNAPGRRPERVARGDRGGAPPAISALPGRRAASGVVALGPRDLLVCGVVSGLLERVRIDPSGRPRAVGVVSRDCRYGVARLRDGRLVTSTPRGLRVLSDPTRE